MNQFVCVLLVVLDVLAVKVMPFTRSSSFLRLGQRCLLTACRRSHPAKTKFSQSIGCSCRDCIQGSHSLQEIQDSLISKYGGTSTLALSFFKFAPIESPDSMATQIKSMLEAMEVLGTVYIAREGINAAMCIPTNLLSSLKGRFEEIDDSYFNDIPINVGECMSHNDTTLFKKLLVKSRKQILTDGLLEELDWSDCGEELPAGKWHDELEKDDPLVIDCRNSYESGIRSFENSIPLKTDVFSESWEKIDSMLENVPSGKKIMTYCTGGIGCVKVNAYLKQKLGYNNVYRLAHGIINYENWVSGNNNREGGSITSKFFGTNYLFDGRRQKQQPQRAEIEKEPEVEAGDKVC